MSGILKDNDRIKELNTKILFDKSKDLLTSDNISYKLNTNTIGKNIRYFESIESTNDYAKKMAFEEIDGTVIISEEQTKGRGRLERKWHSKFGEGIWMSMILKPNIMPKDAPFITLIAGASIVKALNELGVEVFIKWPNDIIINNRKVAGILTEISTEIDKINYIVLGIGINIKTIEFSQEISEIATSLYKEGYEISRVGIVQIILEEFEKLYLNYINKNIKKETLSICRLYSSIIGKDVYLIKGNEKEIVKCLDMNDEGNLIVQDENNIIKEIISGELSIRGVKGYV